MLSQSSILSFVHLSINALILRFIHIAKSERSFLHELPYQGLKVKLMLKMAQTTKVSNVAVILLRIILINFSNLSCLQITLLRLPVGKMPVQALLLLLPIKPSCQYSYIKDL